MLKYLTYLFRLCEGSAKLTVQMYIKHLKAVFSLASSPTILFQIFLLNTKPQEY